MSSAFVRAQLRRVGAGVALAPIIVSAVLSAAGWVMATNWPLPQAMTLTTWLVQIYVICAGVCVAVAVTGDPLIELHESTVAGFRTAQLVRAGAMTVAGTSGAILLFEVLHGFDVWPRDIGWSGVLFPVGAVIFLAVISLATAAFSGASSATTIAVVAAWMFLAMLWDPYVLPLLPGRGIPLFFALVLAVVAWWRLGDAEQNLRKVDAA